jgi:uncharacterized membrane protein
VNDTTRTETFSDGVIAIAITLLVLDLRVPVRDSLHGSLAAALGRDWPAYFAYVTSFLIIGIIWVNHHAVFRLLKQIDRMAQFLNLVLLMFVAAIPFTTALMSEYLTAPGPDARTAAVVYSAVMMAMSIGFAGLYTYAAGHPELLADDVDAAAVRGSTVRFTVVGNLAYLVTIGVAFASAPACLALHLVIALYYTLTQTSGPRGAPVDGTRPADQTPPTGRGATDQFKAP